VPLGNGLIFDPLGETKSVALNVAVRSNLRRSYNTVNSSAATDCNL